MTKKKELSLYEQYRKDAASHIYTVNEKSIFLEFDGWLQIKLTEAKKLIGEMKKEMTKQMKARCHICRDADFDFKCKKTCPVGKPITDLLTRIDAFIKEGE